MSAQLGEVQPLEIKKQLLEVQPHELKFTFEVKKQSSCAVHLTNVSDQYIAFKIKTTSPKKYCVRPNIGVVKPKSTCDFTVTMQAQRSPPLDMLCKDKFLIQSTVAPFGTSEEDITPGMFAKDSGKYIEECKLKVVLNSPSNTPVLSPVNGVTKQEQSYLTSTEKEKLISGVENLPPSIMLEDYIGDAKLAMVTEELKSMQAEESVTLLANNKKLMPDKDADSSPLKVMEGTNLKLSGEIEELKPKLFMLDSKLNQAEITVSKLKEEMNSAIREKETLKQELAMLRKNGVRLVQVGFPPLFVCMVALISLTVGYIFHS